MRQLRILVFHEEPVTRQVIRYTMLILVLFALFTILPIRKRIETKGKHATTLVASDGEPLATYALTDGTRNNIPILEMDDATLNILSFLIAREDPKLFQENSLTGLPDNFRGISGRNFSPWSLGGGSTMSQQLLKWLSNPKMVGNSRKRTIFSKLGEMAGAYKLTGAFTPNEVLQMYVNEVSFFKHAVGGLQLNAIRYFDVNSIKELNLIEQYLLARSVKGVRSAGIDFSTLPSISRDSLNTLIATSFRTMLINKNKATEGDLEQLLTMPIRFRKTCNSIHDKPYLLDLIRPLEDSLKAPGNQYLTTLRPNIVGVIDHTLEKFVQSHKKAIQVGYSVLDVNVVVLDTRNGEIVGTNSRPLFSPKHFPRIENHIFVPRPIASTVKPLLLAEGIEAKLLNEHTSMIDQYRGRIHNYNPVYFGKVDLAFLVKKSLNTPIDNSPFRNAMEDGLENDLRIVFASEVTKLPSGYGRSQYCLGQPRLLNVIQLAQLYRAIVTDGRVIRSRFTRSIVSTEQYPYKSNYEWEAPAFKIFSGNTCKSMRTILKAPLSKGGTLFSIGRNIKTSDDVFGKTGTSDSYVYGWTILVSEPYLVAVSMSYWNTRKNRSDNAIPIPTKSGAGSCGPIAVDIINSIKN